MFGLHPATVILLLATGLYTVIAAVWDTQFRRIPNKLTFSMLGAGLVYQVVMSCLYGWGHLGDGLLGFAIGFGILFVIWMVGSGGGGDVKLFGALSIWLGSKLTLYILFVSILIVLLGTVGVVMYSVVKNGFRNTRKQYTGTGKTPAGQKPKSETLEQKQNRRLMAFAIPVAIATWSVLLWKAPQLNVDAPKDNVTQVVPASVQPE